MGHTHSMEVLLDGKRLDVPRPTLAAALKVAVEEAQRAGRIIVEVRGDGARLTDDMLAAPSDDVLGTRTLAFTSEDPRLLVARSMQDAEDLLGGTREKQQSIAERVQAGDLGPALSDLSECFKAWQVLHDVVSQGCAVLGWDIEKVAIAEGASLGAAVADLRGHLRNLRDALEAEDWSAVSDIVGYDLETQATRWQATLRVLADRAAGGPGE
ncbi:MAG: hypothetical protein DYG92_05030 [Leptolyngbya sp. PLA1]|nr:hypothetical protein [Leptolyngbya sp. PLA1]